MPLLVAAVSLVADASLGPAGLWIFGFDHFKELDSRWSCAMEVVWVVEWALLWLAGRKSWVDVGDVGFCALFIERIGKPRRFQIISA